jgi:N-succinyldiaminopimelate aminotransferase
VLKKFLLYRTYHGNAMSPPVQAASVAAWKDEAHVRENRKLYATKFAQATPIIASALRTAQPEAAFYLWARTPIDDTEYSRRLFAERNVTVLPGSFLARTRDGLNPGAGFVRIALVAGLDEVLDAARRIAEFTQALMRSR